MLCMELPAIKLMEQYARDHADVISLSQGIPSSPSDPRIRLAVIESLLSDKVDKYSDPRGISQLREAISHDLIHDDMSYSSDEVIVTAGAIEAMTVTMLSLLQRGDEIIIPTPTYSAFFRSSNVAGLTVKQLALDETKGWELDLAKLKAMLTPKTKAILLCHPNNPTGSILSKKQWEEIMSLALKHNVLIFLDEVYRNMYYQEDDLYNPCTNPAWKDQIVRIVSFSKDFSLTGWRVGFLHSSSQLVKKIVPTHDTVINCAPVISQYAALAAIMYASSIIAEKKEQYRSKRQLMGEYLEDLKDRLSFVWPKGAYFFFPNIVGLSDSRAFCLDLVHKAKVAAVPGSDFGAGGEGHIRLCFGREQESITQGMERFAAYLKEL